MKRWLVPFALLMSNLSGCMYYAYPMLTHVPEVTVPNHDNSVHAFRVDVDQTHRRPQPPITQYTLARIKVGDRGVVPSQVEVATTSGVYNPFGVMDATYHEHSEFTMLVRVYRPGFNTQTVKAWEKARDLRWTKATELVAQEKAIDDLLAVPPTPGQTGKGTWWEMRDDKTVSFSLQPGGVAGGHAEVLRFASKEYERLGASSLANAADTQTIRDRLRNKSAWLRTFAEQAATP